MPRCATLGRLGDFKAAGAITERPLRVTDR
jgi:hypothetical protein